MTMTSRWMIQCHSAGRILWRRFQRGRHRGPTPNIQMRKNFRREVARGGFRRGGGGGGGRITPQLSAGARGGRVTIHATSVSGAPDGYVDNVSLDVADASLTAPAIASATPANNAVNVGPVVNIAVTIEDRVKAVDLSSVQLYLDDALV